MLRVAKRITLGVIGSRRGILVNVVGVCRWGEKKEREERGILKRCERDEGGKKLKIIF